jgi:hypothetical protein
MASVTQTKIGLSESTAGQIRTNAGSFSGSQHHFKRVERNKLGKEKQ